MNNERPSRIGAWMLTLSLALLVTGQAHGAPPDGAAVKGSGPAIYLMHNGKRRLIPSWPTMLVLGTRGVAASMPDAELAAIPIGPSIPEGAERLPIKGSAATVWFIEAGKKRVIASWPAFLGLGFQAPDIVTLPDANLTAIPDGAEYPAPLGAPKPARPGFAHCGQTVQLRSWKGDFLHRPDTAQGVTSWHTGAGNLWSVECTGDKIQLRSWKGDFLHRPDTAQGVTSWHTGVGNLWSIEALGDRIRLRSWKGDFLHRPDTAQGVTSWHTGVGNEWTVVTPGKPSEPPAPAPQPPPPPPVTPPSPGIGAAPALLRSRATGLCLHADVKRGAVALADCGAGPEASWRTSDAGQLQSAAGAACLDPDQQDGAKDQAVALGPCNGMPDQRWVLFPRGGGGAFEIHNVARNTCLDVGAGGSGASAKLAVCAGTPGQRFVFAPDAGKSSSQVLERMIAASRPSWFTRDLIERAVRQHAPIFYLHPEEPFLPSSVEWFLERATLHGPDGRVRQAKDWLTGLDLEGDGYWLELPESARGGAFETTTAYVHARPIAEGDFLDLQFWIFYPYNGGGAAGLPVPEAPLPGLERVALSPFGSHTGDWECVTLRLRRATLQLAAVQLSAHGDTEWRTPGALEQEGGRVVFYASRNGHGAYAQPGANPSSTILRNDTARGRRFDMLTRYRIISDAERPFDLPGRWGPKVDHLRNIEQATSLVPPQLRDLVRGALAKAPERESDGPESITTRSYWLWEGSADAICGKQRIRDAKKCGTRVVEDLALCGGAMVTDGPRCGVRAVRDSAVCGFDLVTDGAVCGWNTFSSVAQCGVACVGSLFKKCSCKKPRSCQVPRTCTVPNTCQIPKRCEAPLDCEEDRICPIR